MKKHLINYCNKTNHPSFLAHLQIAKSGGYKIVDNWWSHYTCKWNIHQLSATSYPPLLAIWALPKWAYMILNCRCCTRRCCRYQHLHWHQHRRRHRYRHLWTLNLNFGPFPHRREYTSLGIKFVSSIKPLIFGLNHLNDLTDIWIAFLSAGKLDCENVWNSFDKWHYVSTLRDI